jgi:hypothetical protein
MAEIPAPMQAIRNLLVGVRKGFLYMGIQLEGNGSPYRSGGMGVAPFASSGTPLTSNVGSLFIMSSIVLGVLSKAPAMVATEVVVLQLVPSDERKRGVVLKTRTVRLGQS